MGLFGSKRSPRLAELEDSVETLKRQVRSMELEWESTYNKLRAIVARLNKRDEREEEKITTAPTRELGGPNRPRPVLSGAGDLPRPPLPHERGRNY